MHITLYIHTGNDAIVRTTKRGTDHTDDSENTIYSTTSIKSLRHRNTNINSYRTRKHDITVFSTESSKPTLSIAFVSTVAFDGNVNVPSPGNVTNSNIFFGLIGGVIGLFLGILIRQMSVKLLMSRKKNKRKPLKRNSVKVEEETYQEINEGMMVNSRGNDTMHNPRESKKYEEFKSLNLDSAVMSYRKLGIEIKRKHIDTFDIGLNSSSTHSNSTKSSDLNLEPVTNRIKRQDYLDVVDVTKEEDKSIKISQKEVTGEGCLDELHHSSLYLEPVCVTGKPQARSIVNPFSSCSDSKIYLDVIQ